MNTVTEMSILFFWIPAQFGGHSGAPYEPMRTSVAWQQNPERSAATLHDVEWHSIYLDDENHGTAKIRFNASAVIEPSWAVKGEILEFRNGYRLLAVGCIQE